MATNGDSPPPVFKLFGKTIVSTTTSAEKDKDSDADDVSMTVADVAEEEGGGAKAKRAHLPCPRCRSRDTKFCYFNNYNVNQPRHFCKACHRYWTAGGALRNVPVGAGRRKNRAALPQGSGGSSGSGDEVERWLRS